MQTKAALKGTIVAPGDKSISHRALIFSALTKGRLEVRGFSPAEDCLSTVRCLSALGLKASFVGAASSGLGDGDSRATGAGDNTTIIIESGGLESLQEAQQVLDAGNSGTTIRLLAGLAAGRPFASVFDGDNSLRKRPMARVLDPLARMGAAVEYLEADGKPPFKISGGALTGESFELKVASAQVQTALLLAGLQADGVTSVTLPQEARDHTTRMFSYLGIPHKLDGKTVSVKRLDEPIEAKDMLIPGDISSAAFFLVAAAIVPGSDVTLKNVGMNPGRTLITDVLKKMGADITIDEVEPQCGEPVADIRVRYCGRLGGATIDSDSIARGIDEIPILALAAALGDGTFKVTGAEELRHKESDRLKMIVDNLRTAGADIKELDDGLIVTGRKFLSGAGNWMTHNDHRMAMTGLVAQLVVAEPMIIEETASAAVSYPHFSHDLERLSS